MTNLTEQEYVQEKLRIAETRYRNMYENAVQGMSQTTLSGQILRIDPAYAKMLGFDSPEELLSQHQETRHLYVELCQVTEHRQLSTDDFSRLHIFQT